MRQNSAQALPTSATWCGFGALLAHLGVCSENSRGARSGTLVGRHRPAWQCPSPGPEHVEKNVVRRRRVGASAQTPGPRGPPEAVGAGAAAVVRSVSRWMDRRCSGGRSHCWKVSERRGGDVRGALPADCWAGRPRDGCSRCLELGIWTSIIPMPPRHGISGGDRCSAPHADAAGRLGTSNIIAPISGYVNPVDQASGGRAAPPLDAILQSYTPDFCRRKHTKPIQTRKTVLAEIPSGRFMFAVQRDGVAPRN